MNNPLQKENHKILIATVAVGVVAAGALAYLLLNDEGSGHKTIKKQVKKLIKNKAADILKKKTGIAKKAAGAIASHVVK